MAVNVDVRRVPSDLAGVVQAVVMLSSDRVLPSPLAALSEPKTFLQVMSLLGLKPDEWDISAVAVSNQAQALGSLTVYSFTVRLAKKGSASAIPQIVGPPGPQGPPGRAGLAGPVGPQGPPGPAGAGNMAGDATGPAASNRVVGIGGIQISATPPSVGDVLSYDGSNLVWGPAVAVTFDISSFATAGAVTLEAGQSVSSYAFTASYTATPTSATIHDGWTGATNALTSPFSSFSQPGPFNPTSPNTDVVFTLTASKAAVTKSSTITASWYLRFYHGKSTAPGSYNEAFVKGLPSSYLAPGKAGSFSDSPGAGEYIYFCSPTIYGDVTFNVGGFEGGFSKVATVSVTNAFGVVQNYDVWRSDNPNLGLTAVTTS